MKSKTLFYLILIIFLSSLTSAVHAQTFSVIHSFTGDADGQFPYAGVTIRGNALYGTTSGGNNECGSVYQLIHSGANWSFSTLAALSTDDCKPWARVVFGPDGHLYGTTRGGVSNSGTVFKLTPPVSVCKSAACYWALTDLYVFASGTDGQSPEYGDLVWDQKGNIYGTTYFGGTSNLGTVYELTPSGKGYTESFLYSFSGPDGAYPAGGLVFDTKGDLFGTTFGFDGHMNRNTVFQLTYVPGVGWTGQALYRFSNGNDGFMPLGGLIFDSAGNLYGTTTNGGSGGGGTVFELSPSGDTWTYSVLYSFSGPNFCGPQASLSMDAAGNLYGTTYGDGASGYGNVFELSNTQNGWVYKSLHDFTGGTDGGTPISNVTIDTDGTFYGTTSLGGDMNCNSGQGCGVVWMIKP